MATSIRSDRNSRFTDVCDEPIDRLLSPIRGYEEKSLVPLTQTVEPISRFFDGIEDYVYVALHNCQNSADGLNQQESASIHLYTMQFSSGPSLYLLLNESLRAENRDKLKAWFPFLKLFLTALHKLPSQSKTVWRGVRNVDLSSQYKTGKKFAWWGVSSCTTDIEVLKSNEFFGNHGKRTLFSIECINGKCITSHSYFKNTEQEVILMPGSYFEVIGQLNPARQLHIIHLKEITPPISFVRSPLHKPTNINFDPIVTKSDTFSELTSKIITQSTSFEDLSSKPIPSRGSLIDIPPNAIWYKNGYTVTGQNLSLSKLLGLYVDDNETVYVADYNNHCIVAWKSGETNGQVVAGGHGQGNGAHQLNGPTDMIVDKERDSLIICDQGNNRVVRWPRRNGTNGKTIISNITCHGLTMDENRYLYVTDVIKHEVRRYRMGESQGIVVAGGNGLGNRFDQLNYPTYIFVDQEHSVFVSDRDNHRVMKWIEGAKEGIVIAGGQKEGNSLTQLYDPRGLLVDQMGTVYIADAESHRIVRWPKGAKQGDIIIDGNNQGAQENSLNHPRGLSFDRYGNLYVVDGANKRVQRFTIKIP